MSLNMDGQAHSAAAYFRAAIDRECELASAVSHGRNDQLNRSSFAIGQIVGAGWLDRREAEQRLYRAAEASGYVAKDGAAAAQATIKSGIDKGECKPREAPVSNGHVGGTNGGPNYRKPEPRLSGVPLPYWTEPSEDGRPKLVAIGKLEPPRFDGEVRRHIYVRDGEPVRCKVKRASDPKFIDWYRVRRPAEDVIGWQAKKPLGFVPVPYLPPGAKNPFDTERRGEIVAWTEGEKDADAAWAHGFLAFTFGSASDVPDVSGLLAGHHVMVAVDNDEAGEKSIPKKVGALIGAGAASIKLVQFPDLGEGGDLADFFEAGGTAEDLLDRARVIDSASSEWQPHAGVGDESAGQRSAAEGFETDGMRNNSRSGASHRAGQGAADWPEPKPLPSGLLPVMAFDSDTIPASLGPWINDISDRMQCPPDFVATPAIIGLAAVLGRKIAVRPQEKTDWTEVPNLWGCIVGRPGAMKSPAMSEALKPLNRLEAEAREQNERDAILNARMVEAFKIKKDEAAKAARAAAKEGASPGTIASMLDIGEPERLTPRRYVANDVTYEKLGEILVDNPNGVLAFRDELMSLLKTFDREENVAARGFFLTAWNGKDGYSFDRIIRGSTHIEAVCVSMLGSTQPGRLAEYLTKAIKGGAGDDGLVQRFSLLVWPDDNGGWREVDRYPESEPRRVAWETFARLDQITPASVGAVEEEFSRLPYLRLSEAARDVFGDWRRDLEIRLRTGGMHTSLESHLSKYRKLVPSLALINHLADGGHGPVAEIAMLKALAFSQYLESHARRAYGSGLQAEAATARLLQTRIRKGDLAGEFTARDVQRHDWSNLSDKDQVMAGLELLDDLGWVVSRKIDTGGRPKTVFVVNPRGMQ